MTDLIKVLENSCLQSETFIHYIQFLLKRVHLHSIHIGIFTLANNFLKWTYLGPTRFIHPWMALFHATLRLSDVIFKADRTFGLIRNPLAK